MLCRFSCPKNVHVWKWTWNLKITQCFKGKNPSRCPLKKGALESCLFRQGGFTFTTTSTTISSSGNSASSSRVAFTTTRRLVPEDTLHSRDWRLNQPCTQKPNVYLKFKSLDVNSAFKNVELIHHLAWHFLSKTCITIHHPLHPLLFSQSSPIKACTSTSSAFVPAPLPRKARDIVEATPENNTRSYTPGH